ncbi:MAG TPA: glycoside hydrolase family 36 protein [Devosia sp.]
MIVLHDFLPLLDGEVPPHVVEPDGAWRLSDGSRIRIEQSGERLRVVLDGFAGERRAESIGLRLTAGNVRQYLRNGYMSWDGSFFVEPGAAREVAKADPKLTNGHAMTALLPHGGDGVTVIGFLRHDRYQSRLRFDLSGPLQIDVETLIDRVPHSGEISGEELVVFADDDVEAGLRRWAELVAAASPLPPRLPQQRLSGWCSWYNLYASLGEPVLLEHLDAAARFRNEKQVPFDIFLVDDGFTPEMGDWLETRPQFPDGIKPVLDAAREKGFTPGLWIAPFMVGNRSNLYREHPDWVVKSRATGKPLAPMIFYGEFRWHKRSEEYYVLDVTHPQAEAYIRTAFRTWAKEWGCGYFKTDFMHLGSTYGPDEAVWYQDGLSRMEIWMRMARLIREEIGDALWLCCGAPIWAPIGLVDAMRIGRDIGVSWKGHYSAESLLRDQTARNFANGIVWQADPDCILLRDRFHELTDHQVHSLALFAGLAGGVLMTSDQLDQVAEPRRRLLAELAGDGLAFRCEFPLLGRTSLRYRLGTAPNGQPMAMSEGDPLLVQRVRRPDGRVLLNVFNTGDEPTERLINWNLAGLRGRVTEDGADAETEDGGIFVALRPHQSRLFVIS